MILIIPKQRLLRKGLAMLCGIILFTLSRLGFPQNLNDWIATATTFSVSQNTTLGFEKLAVVSTGPSWRQDGLYQAASFTGLSLEIPFQPSWPNKEIDEFRGLEVEGRNSTIGRGQAKCWLGHLNVLREMLAQKWSTALIMEDDVDWDITIKRQISRIAPLIREVTNSSNGGQWSPYGNAWDLLWLGHCGDTIPGPPVASFIDKTLPPDSLYRENEGRYTEFPRQLRMVYMSEGPICTYAYAVTASAASKIFALSKNGMDRIITTELREWCQRGYLRCVTVNPELFHHHKHKGEIGSEIAIAEGWEDLAAPATVEYTPNIRYSARCNSKADKLVTCQDEFEGKSSAV